MSTIRLFGSLIVIGLLTVGGCAGTQHYQPSEPQLGAWQQYYPGKVDVRLRDSVDVGEFLNFIAAPFPDVRLQSSHYFEPHWSLALAVPDGKEDAIIERLQSEADRYIIYAGRAPIFDLR